MTYEEAREELSEWKAVRCGNGNLGSRWNDMTLNLLEGHCIILRVLEGTNILGTVKPKEP